MKKVLLLTLIPLVLFVFKSQAQSTASSLNSTGVEYYDNEDYNQAMYYFKRSLKMDPNYALAHYNLGLCYEELGFDDSALTSYAKCVAIGPDADAYYRRGVIYYYMGDKDIAAMKEFDLAIKTDASYFRAYAKKGALYNRAENYNEAIIWLDKAIALNAEYYNSFLYRGNAYYESQRYAQAIKDYNKAIELDPEDPVGYYNRGLAKYFSGDKNGGCADFRKAKELGDPDAQDELDEKCGGN